MGNNINSDYIYQLMCDTDNKIVLYNIDNTYIDIQNCPCGLIYSLERRNAVLYVAINFIATKYSCRKVGYASLFLREFIEYIKEKYSGGGKQKIVILLDSVMEAVTFYEHIGFKWVIEPLYDEILNISKMDIIEHFVMEYIVCSGLQ